MEACVSKTYRYAEIFLSFLCWHRCKFRFVLKVIFSLCCYCFNFPLQKYVKMILNILNDFQISKKYESETNERFGLRKRNNQCILPDVLLQCIRTYVHISIIIGINMLLCVSKFKGRRNAFDDDASFSHTYTSIFTLIYIYSHKKRNKLIMIIQTYAYMYYIYVAQKHSRNVM